MKRILICMLALVVFLFASCGSEYKEEEVVNDEPAVGEVDNNDSTVVATWALLDENYMFAIEDASFDGDSFGAGNYVFELISAEEGFAAIFDIYIENVIVNSIGELNEIDYSVGGQGAYPIEMTLNSGEYVYVVPYADLVYEPTGMLQISKIK